MNCNSHVENLKCNMYLAHASLIHCAPSFNGYFNPKALLIVWRGGEGRTLEGEKYRGEFRNLLYFLKEYLFKEVMETSQHLFLSCDFYDLLWHVVWSWLGVSGPDPFSILDHLYQFITHSMGGSHATCSFMQLWLLCAWTIWNDRNNRLFTDVESSIDKLLDEVKYYSLWWLKASNTNFVFDFTSWWSSPLLFLGIG